MNPMAKGRKRMKPLESTKQVSGSANFFIIGNRLAIDLGNTLVAADGSGDALRSWGNLVDFLVASGQVDPRRGNQIKALAQADPEGTGRVLRQALELRGAVRSIAEALAGDDPVEAGWVEPINALLQVTEGHDELMRADGAWRLGFVRREQRLEWLLAGVARSAAELVAEGPDAPVRKCGNADCGLYFYDTSRTGRRRWCSMAACGNRSKVAAFAIRKRRRNRKGAG
jgi:predicted RNA-binding Zn ribbon-like protein